MAYEYLKQPVNVLIYLEKDDYKKLRSLLVLKDASFSEWVRKKIREYLRKEHDEKK